MTGLTDRVMTFIAEVLQRFGKSLWTGTWSTGDLTVSDTDKYAAFIILQNGTPILAVKGNNMIRGFGLSGSAGDPSVYTRWFGASISGNKWTMQYNYMLYHKSASNHATGTTSTITEVIGLIPDLSGGGYCLDIMRTFKDWRCQHGRVDGSNTKLSCELCPGNDCQGKIRLRPSFIHGRKYWIGGADNNYKHQKNRIYANRGWCCVCSHISRRVQRVSTTHRGGSLYAGDSQTIGSILDNLPRIFGGGLLKERLISGRGWAA